MKSGPEGRVPIERGRKKGTKQKIQLGFTKRGEMRFMGHLELAHLFHRASKRAGLPLCYSEGFHPMPRIIFARALPVGVESLNEIVHLELERRVSPQEVRKRLNAVLPGGIEIMDAREVIFLSSSCSFSLHARSTGSPWIISSQRRRPSDELKRLWERKNSTLIRRGRGKREGLISGL